MCVCARNSEIPNVCVSSLVDCSNLWNKREEVTRHHGLNHEYLSSRLKRNGERCNHRTGQRRSEKDRADKSLGRVDRRIWVNLFAGHKPSHILHFVSFTLPVSSWTSALVWQFLESNTSCAYETSPLILSYDLRKKERHKPCESVTWRRRRIEESFKCCQVSNNLCGVSPVKNNKTMIHSKE